MAVLNEESRVVVWSEFMRDCSTDRETISINKPDLRAAIDALDDFLDDNATLINNALPLPARSVLTTQQKALLLSFVVLKRYKVI